MKKTLKIIIIVYWPCRFSFSRIKNVYIFAFSRLRTIVICILGILYSLGSSFLTFIRQSNIRPRLRWTTYKRLPLGLHQDLKCRYTLIHIHTYYTLGLQLISKSRKPAGQILWSNYTVRGPMDTIPYLTYDIAPTLIYTLCVLSY